MLIYTLPVQVVYCTVCIDYIPGSNPTKHPSTDMTGISYPQVMSLKRKRGEAERGLGFHPCMGMVRDVLEYDTLGKSTGKVHSFYR